MVNLVQFNGNNFVCINIEAWLCLVCAVYLDRHKNTLGGQTIHQIFDMLMESHTPEHVQGLLTMLSYPPTHTINTMGKWCDLVKGIKFQKNPGKEAHLLPSKQALSLHCKRTEYIMKLAFCAPFPNCPELLKFDHYGWKGTIDNIRWDAEEANCCWCHT